MIAAGVGLASPAHAQSTVYIPAVLELSGAGAVSGTNFRDGMLMAIDEINAKGGILGRKIETPLLDTQSDAGTSRAQIQKVLDNKPYVILGPVFSGSVLVDMMLTQQAEIPRRRSRGDHAEGRSLRLPHLLRPAIQHAEDRQLHP